MSKWEKISIFDAVGNGYRSFFDEHYGLITRMSIKATRLVVGDVDDVRIPNVYIKKEESNDLVIAGEVFDIKTLSKTKFYKLKETPNRGYYNFGIISNRISMDRVEPIEDYKCKVVFDIDYIRYNERLDSSGRQKIQDYNKATSSIEITISNENEFKNFTIWATKDDVREYVCPIFMNLKEEQTYYYVTKGICVVNKVYEWKGEDSSICNVSFADSVSNLDIVPSDIRFVEIPMNHKNELDIFSESTNELFLQPLVKATKERDLINIMWQPIEDAARYVIKLYKIEGLRGRKTVYFLKDYEVDRNEHWLTMPNIIIDNHVVVITAENRLGETIAKSKGINVLSGKFVGDR